MAGTIEFVWLDVKDANGNWIPNPVIPQADYVKTVQDYRLFQFTDAEGKECQGRGIAGFAFQGWTYTQEPGNAQSTIKTRQILAPTVNILDAPAGEYPDSGPWKDYVIHCDNLPTPPTATPVVHGLESIFKGLWELGYVERDDSNFNDPLNPCGPGQYCNSYVKGPMKLGYLYGYAGDPNQAYAGRYMSHSLKIGSLGGCKAELTGRLPYCPGFTQTDSDMPPGNSFSAETPSESYIFLDGSRVIRIKLQTWFAALTDSSFPSYFYGPGYFMDNRFAEFDDNAYVSGGGEDPAHPWYQAGMQYSSYVDGVQVWGQTMQHVAGNNFWQMSWFKDNTITPNQLEMVVKTWYRLPPNPDGSQPDDPIPDPWSVGIDQYQAGQTGVRPPDDCLFVNQGLVRTCIASGNELFQVNPTYTDSPGFTWNLSKPMNNLQWAHIAYYCKGVLIGQKTWDNWVFGPDSYGTHLNMQNPSYSIPGGGMATPYPSCANLSIFPFDRLGDDNYPFATMNLTVRNGLALTFVPVFPTNSPGDATVNFGDGSDPVPVQPLQPITHTYQAAGSYTVSITLDGRTTNTVFYTSP